MTLRIVTEASTFGITLDEIRRHLRLTTLATGAGGSSNEDAVLNSFIRSAYNYGENYTRRAWGQKTYELTLDEFPSAGIELPMPPLSSMSTDVKVRYTNSTGGTSTIVDTAVAVDYQTEPGWVMPSSGNEWPDTSSVINAVRVQYVSGYTSSTGILTSMPEAIRTWLKMRVAQMYEFREPVLDSMRVSELPRSYVDGLLDPYTIMSVST